jgi:replicative DNA helicase
MKNTLPKILREEKNWNNEQKNYQSADERYWLRVPPHAKDVEEVVLGACMLEANAIERIIDILPSFQCFYVPSHQIVYNAILELRRKANAVDIIMVTEQLRNSGELEKVGGATVIGRLIGSVSSSANIESHAYIIKEKYIGRQLIYAASTILSDVYDESIDVFTTLNNAEKNVSDLSLGFSHSSHRSVLTLTVELLNRVQFLKNNTGNISGVVTGFPALDAITCGWQPTDLIIIAARPSVGKTAFALNLARNAVRGELPTPTVIYSMEMSSLQLDARLLAIESRICLDKINRGKLNESEMSVLMDCASTIGEYKLYIDDTPGLNIFELRSRARKMVRDYNVGLIIIDYLQLMNGVEGIKGNREQEISTISRSLKALAKELKIPIIALSQMSRLIESRKSPDPQLSDLRESGAIEQDADFVAFLSRTNYQKLDDEIEDVFKDDAELIIKKHRNGALEKLAFKTVLSTQSWLDPIQYNEYVSGTTREYGKSRV